MDGHYYDSHICAKKWGSTIGFLRASLSDVLSRPLDPHPGSATEYSSNSFARHSGTRFFLQRNHLVPGPAHSPRTISWPWLHQENCLLAPGCLLCLWHLVPVFARHPGIFSSLQRNHLVPGPAQISWSWLHQDILLTGSTLSALCICNESTCFLGLQIRSTSSSLEISDSWPHFQLFQPQCLLGH